jgi:hypothetical protein
VGLSALVSPELGLHDVVEAAPPTHPAVVPVLVATFTGPVRIASAVTSMAAIGPATDAIPGPFRLVEYLLEQATHVLGDALHHGEDLLEHVSHQIRGGDLQIVCELPDVVGQLLGDSRVENALLALSRAVSAAAVSPLARSATVLRWVPVLRGMLALIG